MGQVCPCAKNAVMREIACPVKAGCGNFRGVCPVSALLPVRNRADGELLCQRISSGWEKTGRYRICRFNL